MLPQLAFILFTSTLSLAQYVCPTGDHPLQAYSTLCPLSLSDTANSPLTAKGIDIGYASDTYDLAQGGTSITCSYPETASCGYRGGGTTPFTLTSSTTASCRSTTTNNGANPVPSSGGNFRKRAAVDVQALQPMYVCPRPAASSGLALARETFILDEGISRAPDAGRPYILRCVYQIKATPIRPPSQAFCIFDPNTGTYVPGAPTPLTTTPTKVSAPPKLALPPNLPKASGGGG